MKLVQITVVLGFAAQLCVSVPSWFEHGLNRDDYDSTGEFKDYIAEQYEAWTHRESNEWDYGYNHDDYDYDYYDSHSLESSHREKRDVATFLERKGDGSSRWIDHVCRNLDQPGIKERHWQRMSERMSADDVEKHRSRMEQHHAEHTACCAQSGEDRETCFDNVKKERFLRMCRGEEEVLGRSRAARHQRSQRCCTVQGDEEEIWRCFQDEIQVRRRQHGERSGEGYRKCCEDGRAHAQETNAASVEDCRAGSRNLEIKAEEDGRQRAMCGRIFTGCCIKNLAAGSIVARRPADADDDERLPPRHHGNHRRPGRYGDGVRRSGDGVRRSGDGVRRSGDGVRMTGWERRRQVFSEREDVRDQ